MQPIYSSSSFYLLKQGHTIRHYIPSDPYSKLRNPLPIMWLGGGGEVLPIWYILLHSGNSRECLQGKIVRSSCFLETSPGLCPYRKDKRGSESGQHALHVEKPCNVGRCTRGNSHQHQGTYSQKHKDPYGYSYQCTVKTI